MKLGCSFCQTTKPQSLFTFQGRTIYRCLDCSLIFASRTKSEPKKEKAWYQNYLGEKPRLLARFKKRLIEIEKLKKPGKILDIGCAAGFFLELAQSRGWHTFGIDTSKQAVNHCRKNLPFSFIFCGSLEQTCFKSQFFETVAVFNTLEHVANFSSFLVEIRRVLKDSGLLAHFLRCKAKPPPRWNRLTHKTMIAF